MMAQARAAYARDVALLPPTWVAAIIESAGFEPPVQLFQAELMHAWCAARLPLTTATTPQRGRSNE